MQKAMNTAYTNTMLLVYRVNYGPISEIERGYDELLRDLVSL